MELSSHLHENCQLEFLENFLFILIEISDHISNFLSNWFKDLNDCLSYILEEHSKVLSNDILINVFVMIEKMKQTNKNTAVDFSRVAYALWHIIQDCDMDARLLVFCKANSCFQKLSLNVNIIKETILIDKHFDANTSTKLKKCLQILQTSYANDVTNCCGLLCYIKSLIETDHCLDNISLILTILEDTARVQHNTDPWTMETTLNLFNSLLSVVLETNNFHHELSKDAKKWATWTYNIITLNPHVNGIIQNGSQILCYLIKMFMPEMKELFGDDPQQIPLHQFATGMILISGMASDININACTAAAELIYWLCMMNPNFQELFVQRNVHEALIYMVENDKTKSNQLSQACCMAFFGLSVLSSENKCILISAKTHECIARVAQTSEENIELLTSCVLAMTTLFDSCPESDTDTLFSLQKYIFSSVKNFLINEDPHNLLFQNACLEYFHAFFLLESTNYKVISQKIFDMTMKIMTISTSDIEIQKKGLILLQQLSIYLEIKETMATEIIVLVKQIMNDFKLNNCIVNEIIVLLLFLEESSSQFRMTSVCLDMHIFLFQALFICKSSEMQVYEDVALRCLKLLIQDSSCLKNMLPSAAEYLPLACVQSLVLLEVPLQSSSGIESALVRASKNGRNDIVQYLLSKGVPDADIKAAIKVSMESQQYKSIGILLKYYSQKQNTPNAIGWDSLGLKYIKPEWFVEFPLSLSNDSQEIMEAHDLKAAIWNSVTTKYEKTPEGSLLLPEKPTNVKMISAIVAGLQIQPPIQSPNEIGNVKTKKAMHTDRFTLKKILPKTESTKHSIQNENDEADKAPRKTNKKQESTNNERALLRRASEWVLGFNTNSVDANPLLRESDSEPEISELDMPVTFDYTIEDIEEWCEMTKSGCSYPCLETDPRFLEKVYREIQFRSFFLNRIHRINKWMVHPLCSTFMKTHPLPSKCYHLNEGDENISPYITPIDQLLMEEDTTPLNTLLIPDTCSIDSSKVKSLKVAVTRNAYTKTGTPNKKPLTRNRRHSKCRPSNHSGVTVLNLSYNVIQNIFDMKQSLYCDLPPLLKGVIRFELSYNQISELPSNLHLFESLQVLDLEHNDLYLFPVEVLQCSQLKSLNLSHNKIENITAVDVQCSIEQIDISHNNIKDFPAFFANWFPLLHKLDFSFNHVEAIPENLPHFPKIKLFKMDANGFETLPESFFSKFSNLENLSLNGNKLMKIEHSSPETLLSLHSISVMENDLGPEFPFFFCKLPQLQSLNLAKNKIQDIPPPSEWKTRCIRELNMSHNNINELKLNDSKFWLTLEIFSIANNEIFQVPVEIAQLINLQSLDISFNKITELPEELGNCQNIWELNIRGLDLNMNPLVLKRGTKAILKYLFDKLKQSDYHNRGRMIVVGPEKSGKTSLIRSLTKRKSSVYSETQKQGVSIKDWVFYRKAKSSGQLTEHIISCWDFSGQEKYLQTVQCFFTPRALYLVVYDLSEGVNEMRKIVPWLLNISVRAPGSPVIIVGTHVDAVDNRSQESEKFHYHLKSLCNTAGFPTIYWITTVDAMKENKLVDSLRDQILDTFENILVHKRPLIGEKVPRNHIILDNLMRKVAKMNSKKYELIDFPVLHESDILEKVHENMLDLDSEDFQEAMTYLNSLGTVLHFKDSNWRLNEYYFIDAEWLFSAVDEFLSLANNSCGTLNYYELRKHFLDNDESSSVKIRPEFFNQYLRIMTNFEVAIPLNKSEILIPSLLSPICPPIKDEFLAIHHNEVVERIYSLPYKPTAFFSTFIIKVVTLQSALKDMSFDLGTITYWKSGIHIYQENEYSLHVQAQDSRFEEDSICFDLSDIEDVENYFMQYAVKIKVPRSKSGTQALGYIVDLLDDLIDEHYPGLLAVDPILQEPLLKIEIPCPDCNDDCIKQRFNLNEILHKSEDVEDIHCPIHNGTIMIKQIAPDIALWDLESFNLFTNEELVINLCNENLLGDGGFGSVYKASFKEQYVAIKVFKQCGEVHPHKLQRKEASILHLLQHKNIVSLLGILIKPRCIVLELATYGSMADYLSPESETICMPVILKIVKDIGNAITYLHSRCLIYRDCKPDNVLLFSLSLSADVNAKLSDYGISTMATSVGSFQQEGTPGYRAPECIKGESYSFPVDMFSLGITIFEIITKGRHPYSNYGLRSRAEFDVAVCKGLSFGLISDFNLEPWPFMQDLISQCLHFVPEDRPSASEFVAQLDSPSFFPLQWEILLDAEEYVERIISINDEEDDNGKVILATKDKNQKSRLQSFDSKTLSKKKSTFLKIDKLISSIAGLSTSTVIFGTQDGTLYLSNLSTDQTEIVYKFQDSILQLEVFKEATKIWIICGLADGCIFTLYRLFDGEVLKHDVTSELSEMHLVSDSNASPILSFSKSNHSLWFLFNNTVNALSISDLVALKFTIVKSLKLEVETTSSKFIVDTYELFGLSFSRSQSTIHIWDLEVLDIFHTINISENLTSLNSDIFVDARIIDVIYHEHQEQLWVGTRGGHILVYNVQSDSVPFVTCLYRYDSPIRNWCFANIGKRFGGEEENENNKLKNQEAHFDSILLCSTQKKVMAEKRQESFGLVKDTESQGLLLAWNPDYIIK